MLLFETKREIFVFFALLLSIASTNLFFEYQNFLQLTSQKFKTLDAKVLNQYQKTNKKGKNYTVLKLNSHEGFSFYTTTKEDIKNLKNRDITLKIITNQIDFLSFLRSFYAPSFGYALQNKKENIKSVLEEKVDNSHESFKTKELFLALFFANPISKELRDDIQKWGISHLIAISGFHIAIFASLLFGVFYIVYRPFQDRYFPYRNRHIDLFVLSHLILGFYVYSLGIVPSLIRAYVMSLFLFFLYIRGIKILSISTLAIVICIILAFFPRLFFSLGFWFSISGVYYIYLYLHYFSHLKKWQSFILLNFWLTILMMPIVHFFFPLFTPLHLLSPFVTMLFSLFYPLEIFLHLIGFGDLLDFWIVKFLEVQANSYEIVVPFWFFVSYIIFSIGSYFIQMPKKME